MSYRASVVIIYPAAPTDYSISSTALTPPFTNHDHDMYRYLTCYCLLIVLADRLLHPHSCHCCKSQRHHPFFFFFCFQNLAQVCSIIGSNGPSRCRIGRFFRCQSLQLLALASPNSYPDRQILPYRSYSFKGKQYEKQRHSTVNIGWQFFWASKFAKRP